MQTREKFGVNGECQENDLGAVGKFKLIIFARFPNCQKNNFFSFIFHLISGKVSFHVLINIFCSIHLEKYLLFNQTLPFNKYFFSFLIIYILS